jgi:hypothetical protein
MGVTTKIHAVLQRGGWIHPSKGWCQTVPNEGNPRLILRLDPLIRTGLEAQAISKGASLNDLIILVDIID